MSSAFVELLQKSNLDCLVTRKTIKFTSQNEDLLFASLINFNTQKLQVKQSTIIKKNCCLYKIVL